MRLTVPLDHFHDIGRTIDVTFALKRHTGAGPAMGTWVTITGGPGTAGIYSAVSYSDGFDPAIRRNYDLVFMDQRGSGMSGRFSCPSASLSLYTSPAGPADPDGGAGLKAAARGFVEACLAESKVDRSTLPYYATRQAVEDLEAFRLWLGVPTLSLYGESYGSQYVQIYAALHPEAVKVLFTDGPVDLSMSGEAFYVEGAKAFDDALVATLLDCTTQPTCSADVLGANALSAYDALAARLASGPMVYRFTRNDGSTQTRRFSLADLQTAAVDALASESDRALLQRAMGPASRGQMWWLARLLYAGLGQNPDTGAPIPDPTYADALFYAVECVDYAYFTGAGDAEARADAYLAYGRAHGVDAGRLGTDFYADLPCAYWPVQPGPDPRPLPAADAPYPMVVLAATLDPATPFQNALRVVARRTSKAGTWLIYKPGGPHIIYGRGNACPDDQVTRILMRGVFPSQHTTPCSGDVAAAYTDVPEADARSEGGTLDVLKAIDDEIHAGVDYRYWNGATPLGYGCPFGGTITYTPSAVGSNLKLKDCAFFDGLAGTGSGLIDDQAGTFGLDLSFSGTGTSPTLHYLRDARGGTSVRGGQLHLTGR